MPCSPSSCLQMWFRIWIPLHIIVNGFNWFYCINNLNQNDLFDSLFLVSFLCILNKVVFVFLFIILFEDNAVFEDNKGSVVFLFGKTDSLQTELKPLNQKLSYETFSWNASLTICEYYMCVGFTKCESDVPWDGLIRYFLSKPKHNRTIILFIPR